jgi:hypothetical protein
MKKIAISLFIPLMGCSVWNDDFDEPVPRAMPKSSIHKISTLIDDGIIREDDDDLKASQSSSVRRSLFADGKVSRGFEDVGRIYLISYEDSEKNLHTAHYLYVVLKPATWITGDQK